VLYFCVLRFSSRVKHTWSCDRPTLDYLMLRSGAGGSHARVHLGPGVIETGGVGAVAAFIVDYDVLPGQTGLRMGAGVRLL